MAGEIFLDACGEEPLSVGGYSSNVLTGDWRMQAFVRRSFLAESLATIHETRRFPAPENLRLTAMFHQSREDQNGRKGTFPTGKTPCAIRKQITFGCMAQEGVAKDAIVLRLKNGTLCQLRVR